MTFLGSSIITVTIIFMKVTGSFVLTMVDLTPGESAPVRLIMVIRDIRSRTKSTIVAVAVGGLVRLLLLFVLRTKQL